MITKTLYLIAKTLKHYISGESGACAHPPPRFGRDDPPLPPHPLLLPQGIHFPFKTRGAFPHQNTGCAVVFPVKTRGSASSPSPSPPPARYFPAKTRGVVFSFPRQNGGCQMFPVERGGAR